MIKGSCFCGEVKFRVNGDILTMTNCHCSQCRKITGAAFGTLALCKKNDFMFISGENHIAAYKISEQFSRTFCDTCGSPLPVEGHPAFNGMVGIPAGLFDDDPKVKPAKHIFVGSKAPWWEITDDIPQYKEWFPGFKPASNSKKD